MRSIVRRGVFPVAIASALAACVPQPGTAPTARTSRSPQAVGSSGVAAPGTFAGGVAPGQVTATTPDGTVTASPPGLASPGAVTAALAGIVRAPAELVSDNGLGVINDNGLGVVSNNGASVVSNNGSGFIVRTRYVLRAAEQPPVAGAVVYLVDALGRVVVNPDGKPVSATTDAAGAYRLPDVGLDHTMLVVARLPGDRGYLAAVAPKATVQPVDLDLVSSLTTAYIAAKYVKGQPDRVATFDRLTPDAEVKTRVLAGGALAAGQPPLRIDAALAVREVDRLRVADRAFDAQMEAVRKLLIPAGQSELGEGRHALDVALDPVADLLAMPDGSLYFACPDSHRIWRMAPDGILTTAAGRGVPGSEAIAGRPAREAALTRPTLIGQDPAGRPLILDHPARGAGSGVRIMRLEPDGTLAALTEDTPDQPILAATAGGADEVFVIVAGGPDEARLERRAGGARSTVPTRAGFMPTLRTADRLGRDASGGLVVGAMDLHGFGGIIGVIEAPGRCVDPGFRLPGVDASGTWRLSSPDQDPALVASTYLSGGGDLALDARGLTVQLRWVTAESPAQLYTPSDGRVIAEVPRGRHLTAASQATDATRSLYVALDRTIHRVEPDGALTLVAGREATATGLARDVAVQDVAGLAPLGGGAFLMADFRGHRIVQVDAAGPSSVFAGSGQLGLLGTERGDGGPAPAAQLAYPSLVRRDAAGHTYVVEHVRDCDTYKAKGRRIAPDGTISAFPLPFKVPPGTPETDADYSDRARYRDLAFDATGRPYALVDWDGVHLMSAGAGGAEVLVSPDRDVHSIALDGTGGVFLAAVDGVVYHWTPAAGLREIARDPRPDSERPVAGLARDGRGRLYMARRDAIVRIVPGLAVELVAGPGAPLLGGTSVDGSLRNPGYLVFDGDDLLVADRGHRQVKRLSGVGR